MSAQNRIRIIGCADRVKRTAILSTRETKQQGSKDGDERAASVSSKYLHVTCLFSCVVLLLHGTAEQVGATETASDFYLKGFRFEFDWTLAALTERVL